jgi:hypothetical protein
VIKMPYVVLLDLSGCALMLWNASSTHSREWACISCFLAGALAMSATIRAALASRGVKL